MSATPKTADAARMVSLAEEDAVKEILAATVLDLWKVVNNLTRLRLLEKARFNEVPQQYPAHLPVEACHLCGASGGELCAGVHEQIPDTRERFDNTSRLEWFRHVPGLHLRITTPRRAGV